LKIRFLVAGERGVFERLKALADKAREETQLVTRLFQERLADSGVLDGMRALEKESDELTFKLSEDIMDGAINPAVLRDLLHLTELMDGVFDDYYFIAREVNRTVASGVNLPMLDKMSKTFVGMVNLADRQLEALGKLLEASSMDEVKSYRKEIEKLEEEGDELKDSGFDQMYENRKLFDYFSFQHYTEVLRKLDDIEDGVEDMSDLILAVANTISR
jgi:predicted phosphate transport protein (TIGR00153 family)